jgi:hypothetical protein
MNPLSKLSFRIRVTLLGFLSIILLLTFVFPPLVNEYSEPTIERITVSEYTGGLDVYTDRIYSLSVYYNDTWHNLPISNATLSANSGDPNIVEVVSLDPDVESAGTYLVTIITKFWGSTSLTINVSKPSYEPQGIVVPISVHSPGPPPPPPTNYLPILIVILMISMYCEKRSTKTTKN